MRNSNVSSISNGQDSNLPARYSILTHAASEQLESHSIGYQTAANSSPANSSPRQRHNGQNNQYFSNAGIRVEQAVHLPFSSSAYSDSLQQHASLLHPGIHRLLLNKLPESNICGSCSSESSSTWYALPSASLDALFLWCNECVSALKQPNQTPENQSSTYVSQQSYQQETPQFVETDPLAASAAYQYALSLETMHLPSLAANPDSSRPRPSPDTSSISSRKLCQSCHVVEVTNPIYTDAMHNPLGLEYCSSCQPFPFSIPLPTITLANIEAVGQIVPDADGGAAQKEPPSAEKERGLNPSAGAGQILAVLVKECHLCKSRKSAKWTRVQEDSGSKKMKREPLFSKAVTSEPLNDQKQSVSSSTSKFTSNFLQQKWACWSCYQRQQHTIIESNPKPVNSKSPTIGRKTCQSCLKNSKKYPRMKWYRSKSGYLCSTCSSNSQSLSKTPTSSESIATLPTTATRFCNVCRIVVAKRWVKDKKSREGYLCNPCHNRRRNKDLGRQCITCSATTTSSWVRAVNEDSDLESFYCKACSFRPGAKIAAPARARKKKRVSMIGDGELQEEEDGEGRGVGSEDGTEGTSMSGSVYSSFGGSASFNSAIRDDDADNRDDDYQEEP